MSLRWLDRDTLLILHDESIRQHGGTAGLRDAGLLDSALMRPLNAFDYASCDDVCSLAAICAAAISGNNPFLDGNMRTAFLACGLFLRLNGLKLVSEAAEATEVMLSLAAGTIDQEALADWLRGKVVSTTG